MPNLPTIKQPSLSAAHCNADVMVNYIPGDVPGTDAGSIWKRLLPEIYDFTSGTIPPYLGSNHLGPNTHGPLKDDPSTPCLIFDLTNLEAETMCISAQEAVYGTESLQRLESIKKAVDPNGVFDCFRCIGNTVVEDVEPSSNTTEEDGTADTESDTPAEEYPSVADEMVASEPSSSTDVKESTSIADGIAYSESVTSAEKSSSTAAAKFELSTAAFASISAMMVI